MPKKIIIDTDPGIDDAMAIFLAIQSPALQLLGLTTIFGNVSIETATQNALRLVEMSGEEILVARGASKPWTNPLRPYPDFVHGKDGFGNLNLPAPQREEMHDSAAQWIVDQVMSSPGEITLIALGPLTNLALALALEPRIVGNVKEVILMGGSIFETGNVSPVAEANLIADPHAGDQVFTAGWPIAMIGLDVTHKVLITPPLLKKIKENNGLFGDFIFNSNQFYLQCYSNQHGINGIYSHDPTAIAYAIHPEFFTTEIGGIRVATDGVAVGQTIMNRGHKDYEEKHWKNLPDVHVCLDVDAPCVLNLFEEILAS